MTAGRAPRLRRSVRRGWGAPALGFGAVLLLALPLVGLAEGGFTASDRNTGNAATTGSLQLSAAQGTTSLCATSISTNPATCTGMLATNTLATGTTKQSLATKVTGTGTLTPTTTTLTQGTCGVVQLANGRTPADPMLVRGGLTTGAPGPLTGSLGVTVDGSSGYASDVTGTSSPQGITEVIWFKAPASTTGGTLMGFSDTPAVGPSMWDRMMWLDNAGKLVYGVYPNAVAEVTSTSTYDDNTWHMAAASISAAGQFLYVDGTQVASATGTTTAQAYTGYWHLGWENDNSGWTDGPTNPYLAGSLADAAIFPTLTAAQISKLSTVTKQSVWDTDVTGGVATATQSWDLGDDGTGVYAGSPSWYTATPCSLVDATVQAATTTTSCPSAGTSSTCAAPSSTTTLSTLSGTKLTLLNPTSTQAETLTVTTARDGTKTVAANPNLLGLHLDFTETLAATAGSFTAGLSWPANQDIVL